MIESPEDKFSHDETHLIQLDFHIGGEELNAGTNEKDVKEVASSEQTTTENSETAVDSNGASADQSDQTHSLEELRVELPPSDERMKVDLPPSDKTDESLDKLKVELPPLKGATPSTSSEQQNEGAEADGGTENGAKAKDVAESDESVYHIKWVTFKNQKVPIITQNENGPCPLLAIMNVLLLKKKVTLTQSVEFITANQVMAHLGNCVLENVPKEEVSILTDIGVKKYKYLYYGV